jgi:ribonucleoside-diphosphate reductase beta chain
MDKNIITISQIRKRDNTIQAFDLSKITSAIQKAMVGMEKGGKDEAEKIAQKTYDRIVGLVEKNEAQNIRTKGCDTYCPTVEEIQDLVENELMNSDFHDVAKAYILYREHQSQARKKDLFKRRVNLKPHEYPELLEYVDAIRHSYWIHTEFNFTSDIQDFKVKITESERNAIKNAMLAIAQIEVAVKTFWGDIYKKLPKPEIGSVGSTFSESEVRHQDAYAHLIEILGLNHEFETVKDIPVIAERIEYLEKSIRESKSDDNQKYSQSVLLFSLFIEHVSLFSQFLIIMAFNKHKNLFKGISNVVEATSKEEQIHGLFGVDLINIIKQEHPEWFDEKHNEFVVQSCREAFESESKLVDWIFEDGELDFLPKNVINEFIKNRFNNSLESIGIKKIFEIDEKLLEQTDWFDDEVIGTKHGDFFVKRSINYNKRSTSVTSEDLF